MQYEVEVARAHHELARLAWQRCRATGRPVEGHTERQWRARTAGFAGSCLRKERVRDEVFPPVG